MTDMDIRNLFSRLNKKVKQMGSKQKPGRTAADVNGEAADPDNPRPQPEPHVETDGRDGNGADEDGQPAGLIDQPTQPDEPELAPANRSEDEQGEEEAGVDGGIVGPMYSCSHLDVEVGMGSRPCQEGNGEEGRQLYSCSSPPLILHGGEPDGVLTHLFQLLPSSFTQMT